MALGLRVILCGFRRTDDSCIASDERALQGDCPELLG